MWQHKDRPRYRTVLFFNSLIPGIRILSDSRGGLFPVKYRTERVSDFSQIEQIYHSRMKDDFAEDELKPLFVIRKAWDENKYEAFFLVGEGRILGYAFYVKMNRIFLLDYFAIEKDQRNQGLGSIFLNRMADWLKEADCMIVEAEDPESAQSEDEKKLRERRNGFYLRNGFRMSEIKARVYGVDYRILENSDGTVHTTDEL